ncbi:MAG: hypothetical protein VX147_04090, partial [Bacteroidota bacterium]|nr:hypothetical protein [Bacteroidota bacterium]
MSKIITIFLLICIYIQCNHPFLAQSHFSVETWRDHLPYSKATEIAQVDDLIYASTPYSLVELNTNTNEITRFSKVNGLSETGITQIV